VFLSGSQSAQLALKELATQAVGTDRVKQRKFKAAQESGTNQSLQMYADTPVYFGGGPFQVLQAAYVESSANSLSSDQVFHPSMHEHKSVKTHTQFRKTRRVQHTWPAEYSVAWPTVCSVAWPTTYSVANRIPALFLSQDSDPGSETFVQTRKLHRWRGMQGQLTLGPEDLFATMALSRTLCMRGWGTQRWFK
jgi:hypothetical protein